MYSAMILRRQYLVSEISKCREQINGSPSGKLVVTKNGKYEKWYVRNQNQFTYLRKKDRDIAEKLFAKEIILKRIGLLEKELKTVDAYLCNCVKDEEFYSIQTVSSALTLSEQLSNKAKKWMEEPYDSNQYMRNKCTRKTLSGHYVRSKSEEMIDMELSNNGIPFRYECALILGNRKIYPDFTLWKPSTGELRYYEHFGMMDDAHYRKKFQEKIDEYCKHGIYPGVNLYVSFETGDNSLDMFKVHDLVMDIKRWIDE